MDPIKPHPIKQDPIKQEAIQQQQTAPPVWNSLPWRCYKTEQWLLQLFCGWRMWLRCRWWGVSTGSGHRYFGLLLLRRHPSAVMQIGRNAVFRSSPSSNTIGLNRSCYLSADDGAGLFIGDDCGFSATVISAGCSIRIGNRVMCGANVTITDSDRHPLSAATRHAGQAGAKAAVVIEDDVWLGMNVVVLKGVTIGKGAVIAANSVVSQNIPPFSLAAGVPARVLPSMEVTS